jgi:ureidoacrylate peracid hydrolase
MFRDYRCVWLADCAGEPIGSELPRSNHEASLLVIQTLFGWASDSERFDSALQARPRLQPQQIGVNYEKPRAIT